MPYVRCAVAPGSQRRKSCWLKVRIIYVTKTTDAPIIPADRPVSCGRGYFLARFAGFFTWGSGGLFSIARSRRFVRLLAAPGGSKSSFAISAARSVAVSGLRLVMVATASWRSCHGV